MLSSDCGADVIRDKEGEFRDLFIGPMAHALSLISLQLCTHVQFLYTTARITAD